MTKKPHAVCIPFPAQGHIKPMLQLAKILHSKGFRITFVNTQFNHHRLLKSQGSTALTRHSSFQFETIPDGLPPPESLDDTQDIFLLFKSVSETCLEPFKTLLLKLNGTTTAPPVSCIVSDGLMSFTLEAADELGVPEVVFWTCSACGLLAYAHYSTLRHNGFFRDSADITNGYLNTTVECIPSMKGLRLKDMPSLIQTTDPEDFMVNFCIKESARARMAAAVVLNTFDDLEQEALNELSSIYPLVYSIGPLHLTANTLIKNELKSLGSSLWEENTDCVEWLDSKEANSVIYVNLGSLTVITLEQLVELVWGLVNSNHAFLCVIRPDLVNRDDVNDSLVLPAELLEATPARGMLTSWCPQEKFLNHPSVGGFLTHCGWNSTLESISSGVPMICWPFHAEQPTNCWYCCNKWRIGFEIDGNVDRNQLEKIVRTLMVEEKGKEMREMARVWKKKAESASSLLNINNLIDQVLI